MGSSTVYPNPFLTNGNNPGANPQFNSLGIGTAPTAYGLTVGTANGIDITAATGNALVINEGLIFFASGSSFGCQCEIQIEAGFSTSSHTTVAAVGTPTSGVAFTPNATFTSSVLVSITATAAGTVTVTMGPTTGAENPCYSFSFLIGEGNGLSLPLVPNGWKVIVTLTGAGNTFAAQVITH
jgi:hypothetical protein